MRFARSLASFLYVVPMLLEDWRANRAEREVRTVWSDATIIEQHRRKRPWTDGTDR